MHITERAWTRITPWNVVTSPLTGDIVPILSFQSQEDAARAVREHNMLLPTSAFGPAYQGPFGRYDFLQLDKEDES